MSRSFAKFDDKTARFVLFPDSSDDAEVTVEVTYIEAHQGRVVTHLSEQAMSPEELEQNIAMALEHGFVHIDEGALKEVMRSTEARLGECCQETSGHDYRLVPFGDLENRSALKFVQNPDELLAQHLNSFCVYDQPANIPGNLSIVFDELGPTAQSNSRNLIFRQGLKIEGNLDAGSSVTSLPQFVHVEGDLIVHNLILTGWIELVVMGNVIASGVVLACDGESGGRLTIGGDLTARSVIGGSMFRVQIDGSEKSDIHWLDYDSPTLETSSIIPTDLTEADWKNRQQRTPLSDAAYVESVNWATGEEQREYVFAYENAVSILRNGEQLFRNQN